eukprot:COSAG02_NODE_9508_length_2192_cov_1.612518_1_plen_22_part_10
MWGRDYALANTHVPMVPTIFAE